VTRKHQWILVGVIVAVVAAGLTAATMIVDDNLYKVKVGTRAPEFSAVTLNQPQEQRSLSDYRGRVVLLNVWATWCEPCKVEMPSMEKLHNEFGHRGLSIVAVSVDPASNGNGIRKFVTDLNLTFDILHDTQGVMAKAYNSIKFPESFVIDRKGVITKFVYYDNWYSDANRALIEHLINDGPAVIPAHPKSAAIRSGIEPAGSQRPGDTASASENPARGR
jgi:cytochrome c biogenesis protein CcmG/thiol:disulfide interchange protein DsbE